jgi:hypothetical protein
MAAWDEVTPDLTTRDRLWGAIVAATDSVTAASPAQPIHPAEHARPTRRRTRRRWLWALAPVGAVLLAAALVIPRWADWGRAVSLTDSHGVRVAYTDPPSGSLAADLVPMTEAELLDGADIFAGTVVGIQGIKVTFSDYDTAMSLLTVRVSEVVSEAVSGELSPGDDVTILVSPAVGLTCSICQVSGQLAVGAAAVFVAHPAAEGWAAALDGSEVFYYSDVAGYYLPDPVRYVFLDTDAGVAFATSGWPSLAPLSTPLDNNLSLAPNLATVVAFLRTAAG